MVGVHRVSCAKHTRRPFNTAGLSVPQASAPSPSVELVNRLPHVVELYWVPPAVSVPLQATTASPGVVHTASLAPEEVYNMRSAPGPSSRA